MSLGDMPRLPDEIIVRVQKLIEMAKKGEVSFTEVLGKLMSTTMGKMMPLMMSVGGDMMGQMMPQMMSMLPVMMGKQIFVKVEDIGYFIARTGMPPKFFELVPSTFDEVKAARIPGVWVDLDIIPLMLQGIEGMMYMSGETLVKVYGSDVIQGWMKSIPGTGNMMEMMIPMMGMMTKGFYMQMQTAIEQSAEETLQVYGV
ncbi:MAG: hypothetical protein JXA49_06475 [Actinobacteria bacterium]|nr:hypothetical protein [Actinomycetota bacterium]